MSLLWEIIRRTKIPLAVALAAGLAVGIVLRRPFPAPAIHLVNESTPSSSQVTKASLSSCEFVVFTVEVPGEEGAGTSDGQQSGGGSNGGLFIKRMVPGLRGNVLWSKQADFDSFPTKEADVLEQEEEIVTKAGEGDVVTVLLLRLDPGDMQQYLATHLAKRLRDRLVIFAGGQAEVILELQRLVEDEGVRFVPLTGIEAASDPMSDNDKADIRNTLEDICSRGAD